MSFPCFTASGNVTSSNVGMVHCLDVQSLQHYAMHAKARMQLANKGTIFEMVLHVLHQGTQQQFRTGKALLASYHLSFGHAAQAGEEANKYRGLHQDGQNTFHRMAVVPLPNCSKFLLVLLSCLWVFVLQGWRRLCWDEKQSTEAVSYVA